MRGPILPVRGAHGEVARSDGGATRGPTHPRSPITIASPSDPYGPTSPSLRDREDFVRTKPQRREG